jgi:hypothetical protein
VVRCDGHEHASSRSRKARKGIVLHRSIEQRCGQHAVFGKEHGCESAAIDPLRRLLRAELVGADLELESDERGGDQSPEQSPERCNPRRA